MCKRCAGAPYWPASEPVQLSSLRDYTDCKTTISIAELYAIHEKDLKTRPQGRVGALGIPVLDQPETQPLDPPGQSRAIVRHRNILAALVLGIEAGDDLQEQRDVPGAAGQRAAMVHGEGVRKDAAPADPAVGRLAADRGRSSDRAAGVGADRPRYESGGDRRAGAAR